MPLVAYFLFVFFVKTREKSKQGFSFLCKIGRNDAFLHIFAEYNGVLCHSIVKASKSIPCGGECKTPQSQQNGHMYFIFE